MKIRSDMRTAWLSRYGASATEQVKQIVAEFLFQRSLRMCPGKSFIVSVYDGFDYLSRPCQRRDGALSVTPANNSSIQKMEQKDELARR